MTSDNFTPMAWVNALFRSRAFALASPPADAELCALLKLGEAAAAASPRLAVELSSITTPRVRALFQGQTTFRTASGLRFTVDGEDIFAATVAAGHLAEARDFEAFMLLVRSGGVVVDVGANFGLYALSAAIYARPLGRVFAFEPAPGAFDMLQRNIADNDLAGSITAMRAAVGAAPGRGQIHVGRDVSFSSLHRTQRIGDEASTVDVEIVSLDTALSHVPAIDLLKIDVEGGEADVLMGARELLARSPALIVQFEFSHKNMNAARRQTFDQAIALLSKQGFGIYRQDAEGPASLPGADEAFSGNLFLAREGQGEARLRRVLQAMRRQAPTAYDLGGLALLQRLAAQTDALKRAEALQRDVIEVADSVVGDGVVEGATEAVRAVQRAWIEARKRAREAESKASAISASAEGRDQHHAEKIAQLRSVVLGLESHSDRLNAERERLITKIAGQRESIAQLQRSLEESRKHASDVAERLTVKGAAWRESDAKLRRRIELLEEAVKSGNTKLTTMREVNGRLKDRVAMLETSLKTSNEKLGSIRTANEELRQRLGQMMAEAKDTQRELSRVRNVAQRMVQRYEDLQARLGAQAETEGSSTAD